MSDDESDVGRFFKEAEAFMFDLARSHGLNIALGRWVHPRHGAMRIAAVDGWIGKRYVTLVCCATDAWLEQEQVSLQWHLYDRAEPFEFKHVARQPAKEATVRGTLAMSEAVAQEIALLETEGDGHA